MSSFDFKSARELLGLIRDKEMTPVELMERTLRRIEEVNPQLNAFVSLHAERSMEEAKALTERLARGEACGPLAGLPGVTPVTSACNCFTLGIPL